MGEYLNIDENMLMIARIAIEEFDKKQKRKTEKKAFHNTKILMENYNDFIAHVNYSVSDINDVQGIVDLDLEKSHCDELFILSIKQSKTKTLIMISHIEKALELLEKEQRKEGSIEKYMALEMYYINKKSFEKIADELECGKNTPGRWVKEMLNKLGIYLFGIDGIKIEW